MKIYNRIVIDIATGRTLEAASFEYNGRVAKCGGDEDSPSPVYSESSKIIHGLRGPLSGAIRKDIITNPFLDQASDLYKQSVGDIRGGYGARGLEGSGIAIKGEQDAMQKIVNQAEAQRAGQLTGLLATASGAPSFPAAQQGGK
jgi:hypothetical protein